MRRNAKLSWILRVGKETVSRPVFEQDGQFWQMIDTSEFTGVKQVDFVNEGTYREIRDEKRN